MSSAGQLTQYFASTINLPAIDEWMRARANGSKNSRDLNGMISLAISVVQEEPLAPDYFDKGALGDWADNQLLTGIDKTLINRLLEQYYTDYFAGRFDEPGNEMKFISNPAIEKYKDTEDWKVSLSCGFRAVATLGMEPIFNDSSPCRVPAIDGKTEFDAFKEATGGTVKEIIKTTKDDVIDPLLPDTIWGKLVLIGGLIGIGFVVVKLYAPKAA